MDNLRTPFRLGMLRTATHRSARLHVGVVIDTKDFQRAPNKVVLFLARRKTFSTLPRKDYSNIHDMKIRVEEDRRVLYGPEIKMPRIKFERHSGTIVMARTVPRRVRIEPDEFTPTGDPRRLPTATFIFRRLCEQPCFFRSIKTGNTCRTSARGKTAMKQFQLPPTGDARPLYEPNTFVGLPIAIISPKTDVGYTTTFDGNFIGEVVTVIGNPLRSRIQGRFRFRARPERAAKRYWIKSNTIVAVPKNS